MVLHADYLQLVGEGALVIPDRRYLQLGGAQRRHREQTAQAEQRPLCEGLQGEAGYRDGSFESRG